MQRAVLLGAGGLAITVALTACGSDERVPFDSATPPSSPDAGATCEGGTPASPLCDAAALAYARSLAGCHFMTTEAAFGSPGPFANFMPKGCFPLFVSNPSTTPVRLRLRLRGREEDAAPYAALANVNGRDVTYGPLHGGMLGAHETAIVSMLFIPYDAGDVSKTSRCPTRAFEETAAPVARTETITPAIELLSDAPVIVSRAHDYTMQARAVDGLKGQPPEIAFPLFPVHLWEKTAIETGIFKPGLPPTLTNPSSDGTPNSRDIPRVRTLVMAAFDETNAEVPLPDGSTRTVKLSRGDVFSHDPNDALIGRAVSADKPVGIVSYAPEAYVSWEFPIAFEPDAQRSYQPAMPSPLWGSEYVAVRHGDRWPNMAEQPPWRIVGGADHTILSYEPYRPTGAPERIGRGELAVFFADASFVVRSQDGEHAFYFSGHMTGPFFQKQRYDQRGVDENLRGGAVSVHQLATSRWSKRYPFFALPRFPEHSLVVTRKRGGKDVKLDCAGTLTGWQPVGESFEFVRVPITGHLFEPVSYAAGTCHAGAHWIESEDPFWATLWAWGNNETTTQLDLGTYGAYAIPLFGAEAASRDPAR